ncbi:MAG: T9SS type A sorting domain-containing protein [Gelidibacter sp.]|nr:T9SS type A sorting domain-containing protein [Gelidibacter sp.]
MKNYLRTLLFLILFVAPVCGYSQMAESNPSDTSTIEGLSIYPNPVSNGKIYITTSKNLAKDIEIFDVLGKKIYSSSLFGKELNISKLTPGIYILKIKENNVSATRKLVVR